MENSEWEKVGVIGVDAGLCWIGDPCYIISDRCDAFDNRDWSKFLDILWKREEIAKEAGNPGTAQLNYQHGHAGLGVCVNTGYGDGMYDVFVKREPHENRIAEVRIVFIGEDDDDEESEDES